MQNQPMWLHWFAISSLRFKHNWQITHSEILFEILMKNRWNVTSALIIRWQVSCIMKEGINSRNTQGFGGGLATSFVKISNESLDQGVICHLCHREFLSHLLSPRELIANWCNHKVWFCIFSISDTLMKY
jgi:hypothetical protein